MSTQLEHILTPDFLEILKKGQSFFQSFDYFRILVHYDGDGTSSAIILTRLMQRYNKKFHLGFIRELSEDGFSKRYLEERSIPTIFVDCGSDQLRFLPEDTSNVMVLDHHFYSTSPEWAININARDYNIDGTREACGATMAFIFAAFIDDKNAEDLLPFMISGCISDKQDMGGFRGVNKKLIEVYGKNIEKKRGLNLHGESVRDSIVFSLDPFFKDLSGSNNSVNTLLNDLGIDGDKKLNALTGEETRRLGLYLSYKLASQGCQSEAMSYLETDEYYFENGFASNELSLIIDANGKNGENATPVEYFLGNNSLKNALIENKKIYQTRLIDYVMRSYKSMEIEKNLQFFYAPGSEMAGAISGILMLYLADQTRPIIGFNAGETFTLISSRGTRKMVEKGLNLSKVMKECTAEVGGSGGGHDIAAGGSIPRGTERQFIEIADKMIGKQLEDIEKY
ncbi:MAG: DHH family phosphoesterase [Candidatus Thermoplasmatota archaeon]|jgi:RecJ-like exonuclease|nr:DHH family phosphoesterase [Candidatus Thermoplasmatota archaeon]